MSLDLESERASFQMNAMSCDFQRSLVSLLEGSTSRYICMLCKANVNDFQLPLEVHCRLRHSDSTTIPCPYCAQLVKSTAISRHIDRHFHLVDQLPYICPFCPKAYNTLKALAQHALNSHSSLATYAFYKCAHCDAPTSSPVELSRHLTKFCISLFHCGYPCCIVKSPDRDLVAEHSRQFHGSGSVLVFSTRQFYCSGTEVAEPLDDRPVDTGSLHNYSLFCARCAFGTFNLEVFADHIASCCHSTPEKLHSLSTTCTLFRCSFCGWSTTALNMLREHIQLQHSCSSEGNAIQTEEFTVPLSEEDYSGIDRQAPVSSHANSVSIRQNESPHLSSPIKFTHTAPPLSVRSIGETSVQKLEKTTYVDETSLSSSNSNLESRLLQSNNPSLEHHNTHSELESSEADSTQFFASRDVNSDVKEYVQLYFNEHAFVAAYSKCGKFSASNRVTQNTDLSGVLQKLRRFAGYKVPILGRANQRRVAGCPECMKPFNHGFTDLKKHLLVTHLNVRKDISRFAIDFTHSSSTHIVRNKTESTITNSLSNLKQHLFSLRSVRPSNKCLQKKFPNSSANKRMTKSCSNSKPPHIPLATVSSDGRPVLVCSPKRSFVGSAPVHRVIPGTGVSARVEDMKSLEEVESETPSGRGGIIPLDENGNPVMAAVLAANVAPNYNGSDDAEVFLPKIGRQHIQLAYSYPVFKRLLEIHNVPMTERVQLINRMNYYSRLHVVMDILAPGGAQKRFSCPTCLYTSIHSLADIRKHILGSHCGISTKRFRLCLRASRHDATTYRLHSDERMIRFVEDHGRRQASSSVGTKTINGSANDDHDHGNSHAADAVIAKVSERDMGHVTVKSEARKESFFDSLESSCSLSALNESGTPHNHRDSLSSTTDDSATTILNDILNAHSEEISNQNEQVYRRIDLPFSKNVLRILLEREGMLHQLDDLSARMHAYSSNRLTVVSRGNRIHAYICSCGRRFSVVREDNNSDIRPASLADCRRHILGVHAKIPQEMLTLCCQASRISKESGYRLYSDTSLLALAEQHKFRNSRIQHCKDSSPSKLFDAASPEIDSCRSPECGLSSAEPVRNQANLNLVSYSNDCPPSSPLSAAHDSSSWSVTESGSRHVHGDECCEEASGTHPNSIAATWNSHQLDLQSSVGRHSGLDLEAPRRLLTADEAACWSHILSLPDNWTLERIVRLAYNVRMFEEHLRNILSSNDEFIKTLHDRMVFYTRHSVYIARLSVSVTQSQRIYVCCACLTTSMHGLGDVRKHILGVHAHIPERFKTVAMNSSRLNREDYSLQCDSRMSQLSANSCQPTTTPRQVSSALPRNTCPRVLRRRQRSSNVSPVHRSQTASPPMKRTRCALSSNEDVSSYLEQSSLHFSSPSELPDRQMNGTLPSPNEHSRPPIIITIPRSKAFSSGCSDKCDSSVLCNNEADITTDRDSVPNVIGAPSAASRSRRSMVLKSKRPCPTTI